MTDGAEFVTDGGIPVPAITRDRMREIDRVAVEETGPSLLQMMEHAGRGLAELVLRTLGPRAASARVVVLTGTGGNGGGGICAGRHLAARVGEVVLSVVDDGRLSEAAAVQLETFRHAAGREARRPGATRGEPDVVVDAILGYSLTGAPHGRARELIEWAGGVGSPVVSLDLPSGVEADTGAALGAAIRPDATLTLALPKAGLVHADTGDLWLADLGIPPGAYRRAGLAHRWPFGTGFMVHLNRRRAESGRRGDAEEAVPPR